MAENIEVKEFKASELTESQVNEVMEQNPLAKAYLQREKDKFVTSSIETWKTNNLKGLIDDEVLRKFPDETASDKRLRELEERLNKSESQRMTAVLKTQAMQKLNGDGLPSEFIDLLTYDTEENLNKTLGKLKNVWDKAVEDGISKATGRKPAGGGGNEEKIANPYGWNPWDSDDRNLTRQVTIQKEKPALAEYLKKTAKR